MREPSQDIRSPKRETQAGCCKAMLGHAFYLALELEFVLEGNR